MIDYNSCSFGSSDSNNASRRNVALIASHRIKKINQTSLLSVPLSLSLSPPRWIITSRTANCRVEKWNKFREYWEGRLIWGDQSTSKPAEEGLIFPGNDILSSSINHVYRLFRAPFDPTRMKHRPFNNAEDPRKKKKKKGYR